MISFPRGKSYGPSDGSEQPKAGPDRLPSRGDGTDMGRPEDHGAVSPPPPASTLDAGTAARAPRKPAWSVLSLADLNEAIRREERADDPARLRQQALRAERERVTARADQEH